MTDDDVIRRRLLIDGDGTGDDRRLNVLLKTLIKWCNDSNERPEERKFMHDKLQAQLAQCEFAVTKSQLSSQMIAAELENYEQLSHVIEKGVNSAKLHIESSKTDLIHAKKVRKNRMEYDALAKAINKEPDRKQTEEKLAKLKKELASLEESKEQVDKKIELRKKQFHVLVTSIQQLKTLLEEKDNDDILTLDDVDMEEIK